MICPTDPQGRNADCSKAPHIVSNSWGGAGGQTWFNDVIKAWNTAGIIGFFAIGNDVSFALENSLIKFKLNAK